MSSDTYATSVLKEAAEIRLNTRQLISILKAAEKIKSDHYLSSFLIEIADQVRNGDPSVKEAYRQTARNIKSETYYGRALRAID